MYSFDSPREIAAELLATLAKQHETGALAFTLAWITTTFENYGKEGKERNSVLHKESALSILGVLRRSIAKLGASTVEGTHHVENGISSLGSL